MRIQTKPTNALQKVRADKELTQREIAHTLCMTETYYCRLENGGLPVSYKRACTIAEFFGVNVDDLFMIENKPRVVGLKPL